MERQLIATSHAGKYSYWLDSTDRYVYQRNEDTSAWVGWLCAQSAWEQTFCNYVQFGPYTEYEAANDKAVALQSRGWRISHIYRDTPAGQVPATVGRWFFHGYAPDRAAALASGGRVHYQEVA